MTRHRLIVQSLFHYWRTNLAILLGVVAGTAVIGGALVVGDSVRGSLKQMTLDRLGKIDFIISGPRFFREDLASDLQGKGVPAVPAIVMRAGLQSHSAAGSRRAGQVNVYGFGETAWSLVETGSIQPPQGTGIVLNSLAARELSVQVGDDVTLWIELPSAVPRDTLLGRKDNDSQEIQLKVVAIAPEKSGLSRLGLNPTQAMPLNAFVDLHVLQERLGLEEVRPSRRDPTRKPARVNALLASGDGALSLRSVRDLTEKYDQAIRSELKLEDLNLRLVHDDLLNCEVLESEQMILEDHVVKAAAKAADQLKLEQSPVMVYLANKLWNPQLDVGRILNRALKGDRKALQTLKDRQASDAGYSMYSTVAGLDLLELGKTSFGGFEFVGEPPATLEGRDVVINEWLAKDLKLNVGDPIHFAYHLVGSRGELPEENRHAIVRGIVKMSGPATDRTLTPQVKGITDVESLSEWDQPFEMNLDAVTARDDGYWDAYRATPKMFLPLHSAQTNWPSRYGTLTSIRFGSRSWEKGSNTEKGRVDAEIEKRQQQIAVTILEKIDPTELGLTFQPVKAFGLMAANGSTDFSGLFFGFSLFLIVAAMILIGLLFRLGIEQRVRDLGLIGAVGFAPRDVRRLMFTEGLIVVVAGGVLGLFAAVGYAELMIYGLTHWWVGAIGTRDLSLHVGPTSLVTGFVIAAVAAMVSIGWALRQLKPLSLREQLSGVTEREVDVQTQLKRTRSTWRRAVVSAGLALVLTVCIVARWVPAEGAFFGVGILSLVAALSFLSARLGGARESSLRGGRIVAVGKMGLRNASRQRLRSVMTAGMIATATFLIVTVAAFRRDPTSELPKKLSGNGGFMLVAESSSPLLYDLNTAEGRKKLQLAASPDSPQARVLDSMHVVPLRVKPGEDASCLNLYQTRVPTILGAPQSLIDDQRFVFASGSWKALLPDANVDAKGDAPIPVLGDANTLMFSLHKYPGQTIPIPDDQHPTHELKVAGMFQDSVFQGVLVMHEDRFLKLYPEQKGFRYFLIEVPPELADEATTYLETELAEYGFDCEPVSERLARFLSVQNTYLSTFQTLGGLGLLLGTLGLATVMLRNVLERQAELALLQAIGFRRGVVGLLVLFENGFVLSWGLIVGTVSAFVSVAPNLLSRGGDVPVGSLLVLLAIVFVTGMLAAGFAFRSAVRLPIVQTLRGE